MEFLIISLLSIILIFVLFAIFGVNMKKLKEMTNIKELDKISDKYMCIWNFPVITGKNHGAGKPAVADHT